MRAHDTFGASGSIPAYLLLVGAVEVGREATQTVGKGEAVRIATGGMLPPGADAVVMVEYAEEIGDGTVEVHRSVAPWEHVLRVGDDIAQGDPIFPRGRRLRPRDLGALTGEGVMRVVVFRRPRVALVSTVDEIVPPGAPMRPGLVYDSNARILADPVRELGGEPVLVGCFRDDEAALREAKLAGVLIGREKVLLDGDLDAKILIDGAIDRTHAALSENFNYSVPLV